MARIERFSITEGWIVAETVDEVTATQQIRKLDGADALGLNVEMPSGYLMVSASATGRYTLSFLKAGSEEAVQTLTDLSQSETETVSFLLDNGETDSVPARETVPLELVIKVAQHFVTHNEVLDPATTWLWAEPSLEM